MTATIITRLAIVAAALINTILVMGARFWRYKALLALFFIVFFSDNLLMGLTIQYPFLQLIPEHKWEGFLICNWSGKLYSIIFTLGLLYIFRQLLRVNEVGLSAHQQKGSVLPSTLVILALAGWATAVGFASPKGNFDPETLVYLAIMPALNEELVYRGYLPCILDKLMPRKINILGGGIG